VFRGETVGCSLVAYRWTVDVRVEIIAARGGPVYRPIEEIPDEM
jgi:hypothetical protein